MRGEPENNEGMFSYLTPAQRVPQDHPLREIRKLVDAALKELSPVFQRLYSRIGRPSIPPERLIRASVLQMLYTIRSERQLMEQLNFNILYAVRGLGMDDKVWDPTVYTKNRRGCCVAEWTYASSKPSWSRPGRKGSSRRSTFTVDGTLIEAWASRRASSRRIADAAFRTTRVTPASASAARSGRTRRTNPRRISVSPVSQGARHEAKLCYMGHALMENRNGLAVAGVTTIASGYAERNAAWN